MNWNSRNILLLSYLSAIFDWVPHRVGWWSLTNPIKNSIKHDTARAYLCCRWVPCFCNNRILHQIIQSRRQICVLMEKKQILGYEHTNSSIFQHSTIGRKEFTSPQTGLVGTLNTFPLYQIPWRMKIYTEFDLATWPRLLKFTELNISSLWLLNFDYNISYHWQISKNKIISGI